jgi:pyruvate formate lyase activating enzyme
MIRSRNGKDASLPGIIFDIQTFSIYDGPGIRTTVFFKGCPLHCSWCQNPESQLSRVELSFFQERCTRCGTCVDACPDEALRLTPNGVDRDDARCSRCGRCSEVCPEGATELIGRSRSAEQILEIVEKDLPFFEESGGGVTLSGGEPALQAPFLLELLDRFREQGIHTALETCGYFPPDLLDSLIPRVDLFLYDLKHLDPSLHRAETGVSNKRILDNFTRLVERAGPGRILLRMPLIPGFNTDLSTVRAILDFARNAGYDGPVHLMPYNPLIKTKYEKIGRSSDFIQRDPLTEEDLARIRAWVEECGYPVVCNH